MYTYNLGRYFEKVVDKFSDATALKFHAQSQLSYAALNAKANRIARYFTRLGVEQKDVVALTGHKTANTFAVMLACLKIGAIYTILDPDSPAERLRKIIGTCTPKLLCFNSGLDRALEAMSEQIEVKFLDIAPQHLDKTVKDCGWSNLAETAGVAGTNPAYIMFTSGSTGFPKGAVITHANVLNLIGWSINTYGFTSDDNLTNVNPLYFDNSVFDFYSALFSGATLVPIEKTVATNPKQLVETIDALACTSWFSVPSLLIFLSTMKALKPDNMKFIKRFIFGGEGYPKSKLKQLYDLYSHRAQIFNVYGPTECTCICSSYEITAADFEDLQGFPPLGQLIPNFSYLILDKNGQRVANGETGELCLLGPGVGSGYYSDPHKTASSFVQNPCQTQFTEIMYKTGDLVRYSPDDNKLYISGRKDNQIKHMGYRIELEEIETALSCLPYVAQAAAIHRQSRGLSQIVAVVASDSAAEEHIVRQDLKKFIPDYMIPSMFFFENELPKNQNGKVDRVRLAAKYS